MSHRNVWSHTATSFSNAKFMIFINFESCDKTCSEIEKIWFLLIQCRNSENLVSIRSVSGKNQLKNNE